MKKITLMFLLGSLCFNLSIAQSFYQMNQMPMFYNPSFAGSKVNGRLSVVSSFQSLDVPPSVTIKPATFQSNYASYDQMIKKIGSGIGISFFNYNTLSNINYLYYGPNTTIGAKIAFAPKYQLKKSDGSIRATLSPSIGFGISHSDAKLKENEYYYKFFEDTSSRYYYNHYEPYHGITSETRHNLEFETSFGLLYNSKRLLLGLTFTNNYFKDNISHSIKYSNHSDTIHSKDGFSPQFGTKDSVINTYQLRKSYQVLGLYCSYTFKRNETSQFSYTPLLQLSFANIPTIKVNSEGPFNIYNGQFNNTFQFNKFFIGVGLKGSLYTGGVQYYGGYQNENLRITFGTSKSNTEVSLNYFFKPRKKEIKK